MQDYLSGAFATPWPTFPTYMSCTLVIDLETNNLHSWARTKVLRFLFPSSLKIRSYKNEFYKVIVRHEFRFLKSFYVLTGPPVLQCRQRCCAPAETSWDCRREIILRGNKSNTGNASNIHTCKYFHEYLNWLALSRIGLMPKHTVMRPACNSERWRR